MNKIKTLILIFVFFLFTSAIDDEFYCKVKKDKYRICRRCPNIEGPCPQDPVECQCENINVYNDDTEEHDGGSECKNGFCYVSKLLTLDKVYIFDKKYLLTF